MKKRRRALSLLLALVITAGLSLPIRAGAAELYFIGINDSVAELRADTMPFWASGSLYVPYTVFSPSTNGIGVDLGLSVRYNDRSSNTITLYNSSRVLSFDLSAGNCRDEITGESYSYRPIMRSGRPFLPIDMVCSFFGLSWSYFALPSVPQGYMIRIKSTGVAISDAQFPDAAGNLIDRRWREYTQSLSPGEVTSPGAAVPIPPSSGQDQTVAPNSVAAYLAILCQDGQGLSSALSSLDSSGRYALFFLTPDTIAQEGALVRQILGTGHSIGILAQGADLEQTRQLLAQGQRALEQGAHARTTLAYVPQDQRAALAGQGWVCWEEDLLLSPSPSVGATSFADSALRRLEGWKRTVHLTLEGGADAARVLPALLRDLARERFVITLPLETRL